MVFFFKLKNLVLKIYKLGIVKRLRSVFVFHLFKVLKLDFQLLILKFDKIEFLLQRIHVWVINRNIQGLDLRNSPQQIFIFRLNFCYLDFLNVYLILIFQNVFFQHFDLLLHFHRLFPLQFFTALGLLEFYVLLY